MGTETDGSGALNGDVLPGRPLIFPVFEPGNPYLTVGELQDVFGVRAIMVNAYFLHRQRELRRHLPEIGLKEHLGFDGLLATDSGAFQAFRTQLHLRNRSIIRFQEDIGSDFISPLDVITPPADNFATAEGKLRVTRKRIEEGLRLVDRGTLIAVQQGGRFLELRRRAAEELAGMDADYVALGSLVPFFTRNHDLRFAGQVIADARQAVGPGLPLHLYGAGDPVELPFYIALGCDVFDSSSFVHYAEKASYMTPYGALPAERPVPAEWACPCPWCGEHGASVRTRTDLLCRHNLWVLLDVVRQAREHLHQGRMGRYLDEVVELHSAWFADSMLAESWQALEEWRP
jgi:7-cyano-7-deazaguanine tRNA-ribosyltransferase